MIGKGPAGVLAAYAALFERDIGAVILRDPLLTHANAAAPQFLNVLRVCDVPDVLGMLAPRPLTIPEQKAEDVQKVQAIYSAAGARDQLILR